MTEKKKKFLLQRLSRHMEKSERVVEEIDAANPSGKYAVWIADQYVKERIRLPEDKERLVKVLEKFHRDKKKKDWLYPRDINKFTWNELERICSETEIQSKIEKELEAKEGTDKFSDGNLIMIKIESTVAMAYYAKGTRWCVSSIYATQSYLENGPLYLIILNERKHSLIHLQSKQWMDLADMPLRDRKLGKRIADLMPTGHEKAEMCIAFNVRTEFTPKEEKEVGTTPHHALKYCILLKHERVEALEGIIAKDASAAFEYARQVVKGKFELGEKEIAYSEYYSLEYAKEVIEGRFELGEDAIANTGKYAIEYAREILKGRFEKGEPNILLHSSLSLSYLIDAIADETPKVKEPFEQRIKDSARAACEYAVRTGKRFELGERAIAEEAYTAYRYARYAINERFELGENVLSKRSDMSYWYALYVLKGRFKKGEEAILNDIETAARYLHVIVKERWPEFEKQLLFKEQLLSEMHEMDRHTFVPSATKYHRLIRIMEAYNKTFNWRLERPSREKTK